MRIHFVNENIGGHATMHAHIRSALAADPDVTATFFDVPPRGGVERAVGARIPGLGRLVKQNRKARMGRNPQTGEAIKIPAKTVCKFRVAKAAKDAIAPKK